MESTVSAEGGAHFTRRRLTFQQRRQRQQQILQNRLGIIAAARHADGNPVLLMMLRFLFLRSVPAITNKRQNKKIHVCRFPSYNRVDMAAREATFEG